MPVLGGAGGMLPLNALRLGFTSRVSFFFLGGGGGGGGAQQ